MTDIDTDALRRLARIVNGPWKPKDDGSFTAAYIAAVSPDVVLALLDELERLQLRVDDMNHEVVTCDRLDIATERDLLAAKVARVEALADKGDAHIKANGGAVLIPLSMIRAALRGDQ